MKSIARERGAIVPLKICNVRCGLQIDKRKGYKNFPILEKPKKDVVKSVWHVVWILDKRKKYF